MIYFPTNWGAKEPQILPNHRVDEETQQVMCETVFHSGCPWVRMYPSTQSKDSSDDPSLHVFETWW